MKVIKTTSIQSNVRHLLSFATSEKNIEREYELYIYSPVRELYGYDIGGKVVGCIGLEFSSSKHCEIKHIAVSPSHREEGIGRKMISFICEKYSISLLTAETDNDAVNFYKNIGFKITSLGEKYPGVERFLCSLECK
ncbi:GNAT family N-acetyltransferase [Bacillus sp. JCM 19034]|uniref:GNAT family N-acetyltransferase n=1 Tax=Bacillus sp. JCM 19034 TaxID=1481928 RepID=UPI000784F2D9|nr:GNAT family N-acetyltransferase [Bacillus sp. JCM 19034]